MKTMIDNREAATPGCHRNLQEMLQEISEGQMSENRVVWSVKINGKNYCERFPHDAARVKAKDISLLEIGTMDGTEICRTFIENSEAIVDCLCAGAEQISAMYRLEGAENANKHYWNLLDSCQGFISMLYHSEGVLKLGGVGRKKPFQDTLEYAEELFDSMYAAQMNEDWINLADLLEFELSPLLKQCREVVTRIAA